MAINKNELARLLPGERLKKLKLMEKEHKKEVDEIETLIRESMKELKTDKLAEEVAPEQRTVDISSLFEPTGEQALEKTARAEAPATAMKDTKGYLALVQTYQDYSQLKSFYGVVSMGGSLTEEQKAAVGEIGERINTAERYMTESEKTASKLDASRIVLYKLKKETGFG